MSTSQTPNYGLHQWAGEDQFKRTDFNEDNAKLDSALHGLRSDVDAKAAQTALNALTTTVNGKASQTDLNALTTKVNAKASQSDLTALTTKVNAKAEQSALTALTTKVNAKAEQSALNALTTKVNAKAEQSALNALSATVSGKGNCRIVVGTYVGTGTYDESGPNTLTFERQPLLVIVSGDQTIGLMMQGDEHGLSTGSRFGNNALFTTWSGTRVSWYNTDSSIRQLNCKDYLFRYIALLSAG